MKKLSLYLLLLIGLSVSTVGYSSTYTVSGTSDPLLSADTVYDLNYINVTGTFTDYWDFSLNASTSFSGYAASILLHSFNKYWDISGLNIDLKKAVNSDWVAVTDDQAKDSNWILFNSLTSGSYRILISGIGIGTNAAGRYEFIGETSTTFPSSGITPVPTPETWAMLLAGTVLVGFQMRRKSADQDLILMTA